MRMIQLMKRGFVISQALLTLTLFTSNDFIRDVQAEETKTHDEKPIIYKANRDNYELFHDVLPTNTDHYIHRSLQSVHMLNEYIVQQALKQSMDKFGRVISSKIGDQFEKRIIPSLQEALGETMTTLSEEELMHLRITNVPAGGLGEKILHVYDEKTNEDYFRFHVRRDQRPNKGYYFNFHYHTYLDKHEHHHNLGTIYWGKNIPQKWNGKSVAI